MGTFKIKCPSCNQKLEADEAWEGMEAECPNCKKKTNNNKKRRNYSNPHLS